MYIWEILLVHLLIKILTFVLISYYHLEKLFSSILTRFRKADESLNIHFFKHRTILREHLDFWSVIDFIVSKYLIVSI